VRIHTHKRKGSPTDRISQCNQTFPNQSRAISERRRANSLYGCASDLAGRRTQQSPACSAASLGRLGFGGVAGSPLFLSSSRGAGSSDSCRGAAATHPHSIRQRNHRCCGRSASPCWLAGQVQAYVISAALTARRASWHGRGQMGDTRTSAGDATSASRSEQQVAAAAAGGQRARVTAFKVSVPRRPLASGTAGRGGASRPKPKKANEFRRRKHANRIAAARPARTNETKPRRGCPSAANGQDQRSQHRGDLL
jgi:hypothetical protein